MKTKIFSVLFVLSAIGCSERKPESEVITAGPAESIVNGTEVKTQTREAQSTVYVRSVVEFKENNVTQLYYQMCGGTLIQNDLVLTAAHCLDPMKISTHQGWVTKEFTRFEIIFSLNPKADEKAKKLVKVAASQFSVHPYWKDLTKRNTIGGDLALIKLDKPAPASAKIVKLSSRVISSLENKNVKILGYGLTDEALAGNPDRDLQLFTKNLIMWSSEDIDKNLEEGKISVSEAQIYRQSSDNGRNYLLEQRDGGACFGDSGGPAYIDDPANPGEIIQIGIAQSVAFYVTKVDPVSGKETTSLDNEKACRGISNYTNVSWDRYRLWIVNAANVLKPAAGILSQKDLFVNVSE